MKNNKKKWTLPPLFIFFKPHKFSIFENQQKHMFFILALKQYYIEFI